MQTAKNLLHLTIAFKIVERKYLSTSITDLTEGYSADPAQTKAITRH